MEGAIRSLARKVFGSANERLLKRMRPLIEQVNSLEAEMETLDADAVRRKVGELRGRHEKGETLDDLLPEAFALVRESAKRTIGQRHFDVQILGGIVLHEGKIAEMKTGEGKTLVATLPAFLNGLSGKGVHVVTVNDYLAKFHADWMGQIHRYLGLEVGCIVAGVSDQERRSAYAAPITYGQNNEFGFDYLRDNMRPSLDVYAQRGHNFAIVDEVDSILVDEARTPLIISGPVGDDPEKFRLIDRIIPRLSAEEHYTIDEKARQAMLSDDGIAEVEKLLKVPNLYAPEQIDTLHVVQNALRAHVLYQRDVDYAVKDGQVVIVDEFTGRLMEGRRWSDGLHQAVEAKEKVKIQNESQTYASITFQNYFRMYEKLSGMTGTADTEAEEFHKIYKLDVVVIPTNQPMVRDNRPDLVYRTGGEKWSAVVEEIEECRDSGQPVLVGTSSIEDSEMLSSRLKNRGVPHNILNAKQHDREADIIAQAGRLGAVTISTNMAGRGTDIILGGNPEMALRSRGLDPYAQESKEEFSQISEQAEVERREVVESGGLHVIGSQRHDARRIDNQLRGRAGRQGDPGSSRFFLSLEDDLMRRFGSDRIAPLMKRLGMEDGEPIEHKMVTSAIERAQAKVEAHNFDIRKHLLEYDDVMNRQRETIYGWRRDILSTENIGEEYAKMGEQLVETLVQEAAASEEDSAFLKRNVENQFGTPLDLSEDEMRQPNGEFDLERLFERIKAQVAEKIEEKRRMFAETKDRFPDLQFPSFDEVARGVLLQNLDQQWKDHLLAMDHLKEGIGLRGYGQRDPKIEYQREGFEMFMDLDRRVRSHAVEQFLKIQIQEPDAERIQQARAQDEARRRQLEQQLRTQHAGASGFEDAAGDAGTPGRTVVREGRKVGRNEACPCGSGKKYKKCHGVAA